MPSIDVKIANLDSTSYRSQDPEKSLLQQEKQKRQKYQTICETHRESFHPFLASTDGMLAPEATKILQHLAHITVDKQQKPYSAIMKHLRLRIAIHSSQSCPPLPQRIQKEAPPNNPNQHPQPTIRTQPRLPHVVWLSNPSDLSQP
jgi:hypothetical protein